MNQSLDQVVASMLAEGTGETQSASRLASGGLTFESHVERAEGEHPEWVTALTDEKSQWSWVFLQEQSQIPGFPEHNIYVQGSLTAAGTLCDYAEARGAQSVFLMTWGRRDGDPDNPSRYPDYTTMQDLLTTGYLRYVETWSTKERPVFIAPAGLAWQHIHDEILASGEDPLEEGSLFDVLYSSDGSHPSPTGNHLNAAVIYATLTGQSPVGLTDPTGLLDAETTAQVQAVAEMVVLGDSPDILYPWEYSDDPDTPIDTDTDNTDTDTDNTDTGSEDSEPTDSEPAASGCRASRAALVLPVLLLLLGARRR